MTEITPELTALADAALETVDAWHDAGKLKSVTNREARAHEQLRNRAEAYRATQAKECRPPANAKDGYLFWLVRDGSNVLAQLKRNGWLFIRGDYTDLFPFDVVAADGWTVHSECRFGETGVVATPAAIRKIAEAISEKHAKANYTAISQRIEEGINEALTHFRAPKLEISDEEIEGIAQETIDWGMQEGEIAFARAVIAKVGGEK